MLPFIFLQFYNLRKDTTFFLHMRFLLEKLNHYYFSKKLITSLEKKIMQAANNTFYLQEVLYNSKLLCIFANKIEQTWVF